MTESAQANSQHSSIIASERGGALIVALMAVVLLMLMGMTLMGVLRGGLIQSSSSEASVQAEVLAQNGLDEALSYIRFVVHHANTNPAIPYRDRAATVRKGLTGLDSFGITNPLSVWNDNYVQTAKGRYKFSIDTSNGTDSEVSQVIKDPNDWPLTFPDRPYVHRVVVKATGISNVRTAQTVVKEMVVYVSSINPVFRYPVSSDADLTLRGSPYILGDVLVEGQLLTTEHAQFTINSGSRYQIKSEFASVKGFIRLLTQPNIPPQFSSKAVPYPDNGLALDENIVIGKDCGDDLTSEPCQAAYVYKRIREGAGLSTTNPPVDQSESLLGDKQPLPMAEVQSNIQSTSYNHAVNVKGKLNIAGNLKIDGGMLTMEIADDPPTSPLLTADGNIFVGNTTDPDLIAADLTGTIQLNHNPGIDAFMAVHGNTELNNFTLTGGNMFIKGNVTVRGTLQMNGTLFVDGDVDFKQVDSINLGANSPLIVVAAGKITLADHGYMNNPAAGNLCNNNSTENINCLRAFLYSKENLSLYGVLSNQVIKGGIHGKNVELNAIRGDVLQAGADASFSDAVTQVSDGLQALVGQYYYKRDQSAANLQSRLQLLYDNKLYTDPPTGIPIIEGEMDVFVKEITTLPAGVH